MSNQKANFKLTYDESLMPITEIPFPIKNIDGKRKLTKIFHTFRRTTLLSEIGVRVKV
jgi:hypothetical protein